VNKHYSDLLKAHKLYIRNESRWKFYDEYMKNKDSKAWFMSEEIPLKEALFLFGFINSWEPEFQGDLATFLRIYKSIFKLIKKIEHETIIEIDFNDNEIKKTISIIFDKIIECPKRKKSRKKKCRHEYTAASKILHVILPDLFVMWDKRIRKAIVGGERNGKCCAFKFLPKMQEEIKEYLESFIKENGGDYKSAAFQISKKANNYTLPKLIDEYNYVRYTKGISLSELRSVSL